MSKELPLQLVFENDPKQLVFANTENSVVPLSIKNEDTRTAYGLKINVVRGDLLLAGDLTLEDDSKIGGGEKVISEKWVECRLASPDAWQPVDDWATGFDLGDLAPGASIAFEIRINLPAGNADIGRMCFALMISASTGEDLRVLSVTIDQASFAIDTGATTTATATAVADVGADDSITWSSSDTDIATINASTGEITGVAAGQAVITAASVVNTLAKSTRYVVISEPSIVAGAVAWYDAADASTITESGGLVAEWRDKSGNDHHLTGNTGKPTTGAATLNGNNVISFGGAQKLTGPDAAVPAGASDYTIFMVWQASGANQSPIHMGAHNTKTAIGLHTIATNNLRHYWWSSDLDSGNGAFSTGNPHLVTFFWDASGALQATRIDETPYSRSNSDKNTTGDNFTIGEIVGYGYKLNGFVAELIIYHTALSSAEIAANEAYLKTKWGL